MVFIGDMIFDANLLPGQLRVHLVDPDPEGQQHVKDILTLSSAEGVLLAGCSWGVEDTLEDIRTQPPHLLLLDLMLAERGAARIMRQVRQEHSETGVVVFTLHDEKQCLLEYLNLGARGFLLKPVESLALLEAIRVVHNGGRFVDPLLPHCLVSRYLDDSNPRPATSPSEVEMLTVREREVCRYLASGYTNAEVADVLRISKRTVETHRASIMSKVGAKSRAQLVHFAIEHGLGPESSSAASPLARN
jgi:DNA-binding NarL/FixJ family response regulator